MTSAPRPRRESRGTRWPGTRVALGAGVGVAVALLVGAGLHLGGLGLEETGPPSGVLLPGPSTLDPCGLVPTAGFDEPPAPLTDAHGNALGPEHLRLSTVATSLDECEVRVNGVRITVGNGAAVREGEIDPDRFVTSRTGGLNVARERAPLSPAQCHQYVYSDTGGAVRMTAFATGLVVDRSGRPVPGVDVCGTTDRVTDAVLATLRSRQPPRIDYPPDSLGSRDPCQLLRLAVANTLPNTRKIAGDGHGCAWGAAAGTDSPWASLRLTLRRPNAWRDQLSRPGFGDSRASVAGRDSLLTRPTLAVPDLHCTVRTAGRTWDPWPGHQIPERTLLPGSAPATRSLTEVVAITVFLPSGTVDQACEQAQAVAAKLWPTLPRPG